MGVIWCKSAMSDVRRVISVKKKRSVGKCTSAERGTLVSMLCACNAAGGYLPPMFIFPRKRMNGTPINSAPHQAVGYARSSGYVDSDLFMKWVEHFVNFAGPSNQNQQSSSLTVITVKIAAVEYLRAHVIHLLTLPPYSTHKMQPLDLTYSKSLKSAFNNVADNFMVTNPGYCITVHEMARLSVTAYIRYLQIQSYIYGHFRVPF